LGDNLEAPAGRCVFSEILNRQTLEFDEIGPPGGAGLNRVSGWRAVVRVLRSPIDDVVTTLFPADCRCCEGPLERASLVPVCDECVGRLSGIAARSKLPGCGQCGEAIDLEMDMEDMRFAGQMAAKLRCRECRMAPPEFDRAVSFGTYEGELRALIGLLKFDGVPGVAGVLGDRLAEVILQLEGVAARELVVVAVPLFRARERQRGYNQSVMLAERALARLRRVRPEWTLTARHGLLARRRSTEAQYVLSRRGRRRNLRGAFAVCGDVARREVLVVDDIMTSGATARECARVLKAAGAARVWVATLARAQKVVRLHEDLLHEDPGESVAMWSA
jgi:ComF family protein